MSSRQPIVLIPACSNDLRGFPSHTLQRKYADAVFYGSGCTPLIIPAMGSELDVGMLLNVASGIFLSGSPSNVNAALYGEEITQPQLPQDVLRDDVTIPLIYQAIQRGVPILGVCRGFQEINVALGGTLHQAIHELPQFGQHIIYGDVDPETRYGFTHSVRVVEGSELAKIIGKTELTINSVHDQGIKQLADGLVAEAFAPDGLIEAFRIEQHSTFGMAMQWHPEWKMLDNPDSIAIFKAFGQACHDRCDTQQN